MSRDPEEEEQPFGSARCQTTARRFGSHRVRLVAVQRCSCSQGSCPRVSTENWYTTTSAGCKYGLMDASSLCVSNAQYRLSGSALETLLYTLLFPPLCCLGLVGNGFNLMVLCSNDIMSRANVFLACLAVCDISFLSLMIPHSLANFEIFAYNFHFRSLYLPSKIHLIAFANWTSAVAIWLVVVVCFERVLGVRSPLHRLGDPKRLRMLMGLIFLLFGAGALTFYGHVSYHCVVRTICNQTQILSVCMDVNMQSWPGNRPNLSPPALRQYVQWTRVANAVFVEIIPLILLIILNMMLLYYVKKRSYFAYESLGKVSKRMRKKGSPHLPYLATLFRRHSDQLLQQKTEHRVAVTVCAVVTSFTITQTPSAVVLCINSLWPELAFRSTESWWVAIFDHLDALYNANLVRSAP